MGGSEPNITFQRCPNLRQGVGTWHNYQSQTLNKGYREEVDRTLTETEGNASLELTF